MATGVVGFRTIVCAVLCLAAAAGCSPMAAPPAAPAPKQVVATVVDYTHVDGCRYLLQVKDGPLLDPGTLEEKYRHDGRKVLIRYHAVERLSVCMAGQPVVIDHIEFSEAR
jgi:hypothetical protein